MIVDHLSRLEMTIGNEKGTEIAKKFMMSSCLC